MRAHITAPTPSSVIKAGVLKAPTLWFVTVLTLGLHSYPQATKLHLPQFADEGAKIQRGYISSLELHSSTEQN